MKKLLVVSVGLFIAIILSWCAQDEEIQYLEEQDNKRIRSQLEKVDELEQRIEDLENEVY